MPTLSILDDISEARLAVVAPSLAAKIRQLATQLAVEGEVIRVVQGLRTVAEQDALYAQGRTAPGEIVTRCPGGHSYHNFGMAVDCAPSLFGPDRPYSPDWHSDHATWKRMEQVGQGLGLDVGANWRTFPDAPHFQLTGKFPEGSPTDEVRRLFASAIGSLPLIWIEAGIAIPA